MNRVRLNSRKQPCARTAGEKPQFFEAEGLAADSGREANKKGALAEDHALRQRDITGRGPVKFDPAERGGTPNDLRRFT